MRIFERRTHCSNLASGKLQSTDGLPRQCKTWKQFHLSVSVRNDNFNTTLQELAERRRCRVNQFNQEQRQGCGYSFLTAIRSNRITE